MNKILSSINFRAYFKNEVIQTKMLLKTIRVKPTADDIHDLRVGLRRINTIIQVLENDHQKSIPKKTQRSIKKIWHNLSDVRDMDVSILLAEKFLIPTGKLLQRRQEAELKLIKHLKNDKTKNLIKELEVLSNFIKSV